ncbi:hypothetical protein G5C66_07770 [Nocardioides sp. KC13]|uniref:Uncharacterized protein n=1 Tax=Nocardioides turkmenicus TaxID=2711220 RepID=A0A6M1QXS9_9ACTN|nr:hypothetical protein [Nocardioides sp. KC13]NGN92636.1 hypothetical protein [Nocardioides sp. KC13]
MTDLRTHIAAAEIALTAAATAAPDEVDRAAIRDLQHLLVLAADAVPSECPALLDEALTSLIHRAWPREASDYITDAMLSVATAHVIASVIAE